MDKNKPESQSKRVIKTRRRLLQAAAQIFAEKGYSGATTRGIAEAAELSELTLFRHFGSKKNLFMAVVQHGSALPGMQAKLSATLSGDPSQDLRQIGVHFLSTILKRRKAILMTLSEAARLPEVRQATQGVPDQQRQMLSVYLEGLIQTGRLRPQDPSLMAQAFLGMLFAYAINMAMHDENPPAEEALQEIVGFFVDIFLEGASRR
ncbi:TetR/AcrR family transcriptional regulator [Chloroflexota bacterium]